MNKYILLLFLSIALIPIVNADNKPYTIKGNIDNPQLTGDYIYLSKWNRINGQIELVDSCTLTNNQFLMQGSTSETPQVYFLDTNRDEKEPNISFVLEPGNITIDATQLGLNTHGTPKNEELNDFQQVMKNVNNDFISYTQNDQLSLNEFEQIKDSILSKIKKELYTYTKSNIKTPVGEFWLLLAGRSLDFEQVKELLKETSPDFLENELGKEFAKDYIDLSFINITGDTPNNEVINVADYVKSNKYTLIDYWASWCGPCRKEIPALARIYNKYKDKGFEIIGISLDMNRTSWVKYIEDMNMTWPQISDLKGWDSELSKPYGVASIPFAILIDQNGEIISKKISVHQLDKKLETLLK